MSAHSCAAWLTNPVHGLSSHSSADEATDGEGSASLSPTIPMLSPAPTADSTALGQAAVDELTGSPLGSPRCAFCRCWALTLNSRAHGMCVLLMLALYGVSS